MASPTPHTACSKLELSIHCSNLADKDLTSKSDPAVLVYTRTNPTAPWQYVAQTETIRNNLNPTFVTPIVLDFFFEEIQYLKFQVMDVDKHDAGDELGFVECRLNEIACANPSLTATLTGKGAAKKSTITIVAEQATGVTGALMLKLCGRKLANKDGWFGKSDPFFVVKKLREDRTWVTVAKSEVVMNNLNPDWQPVKLNMQRLCNGDHNRPLRIEVLDYDKDDVFEAIGYCETSAVALLTPGWSAALKHPKGKAKDVGTLSALSAQMVVEPTLVEYLQGGLEIGLITAIDFTGSNGDPRDARSLHYNNPNPEHQNPYEIAIRAVGDVLVPYDRDGMVPSYGYGAELPPTGVVSHCFALNGQPANPFCPGVEGILGAYNMALSTCRLSGPTCFAPVIQSAAAHAQSQSGGFKYSVLLIITDGEIMDMPQTIDAIIRASDLPLSIVIVGVGRGPFGSMERLDGDNSPLSGGAGGNRAQVKRDIVQFVKMLDYPGFGSGARLARDVLYEIPQQVVGYFMSKGRPPPPPQPKNTMY